MRRFLPILLAALVVLAGCVAPEAPVPPAGGATVEPPQPGTPPAEVTAPIAREENPAASDADLAALVAGNTRFALDLYHLLAQADGNLFYSPYSISQALAMTYAGAREETAAQMAATLGFTLEGERLHAAVNALDQVLASRAEDLGYQEGTGFRLEVANALWGQDGYTFLDAFLEALAKDYGAGMHLVDYVTDPEAARQEINAWVLDKTEGRIKDLLAPGTVDNLTRLVLANAIYMKASWLTPFDPANTADGPFTLADGSTVTVPMMHSQERLNVSQASDLVAIELPYIGDQLRMTILMPAAGTLGDFEEGLSAERLEEILAGLDSSEVRLTMPKFRAESEFELAEVLQALGMTDAFAPGVADFSGMDGTRDLYISAVVHKSFVAVDETGTEAAAATAVAMRASAALPSEPLDVVIDHPFLFLIRDQGTGAVLFVGRIANPS